MGIFIALLVPTLCGFLIILNRRANGMAHNVVKWAAFELLEGNTATSSIPVTILSRDNPRDPALIVLE